MNPCCLVMEYIPNGNLLKYLQDEKNQVSMVMKLKIALNIAGKKIPRAVIIFPDAMRFLHSKTPKIIHRDLKTPNILVTISYPWALLIIRCCLSMRVKTLSVS
jgi:serine/threonine protein kinase